MALLKERDCAGCTRQAEWGCDARFDPVTEEWESPARLPVRINDEEVWRCPRRPIKDDPKYWGRLLSFYGMYKKGHLPDPGSVSEQSNKALSLFRILDDVAQECADAKAEEERRRRAK